MSSATKVPEYLPSTLERQTAYKDLDEELERINKALEDIVTESTDILKRASNNEASEQRGQTSNYTYETMTKLDKLVERHRSLQVRRQVMEKAISRLETQFNPPIGDINASSLSRATSNTPPHQNVYSSLSPLTLKEDDPAGSVGVNSNHKAERVDRGRRPGSTRHTSTGQDSGGSKGRKHIGPIEDRYWDGDDRIYYLPRTRYALMLSYISQ